MTRQISEREQELKDVMRWAIRYLDGAENDVLAVLVVKATLLDAVQSDLQVHMPEVVSEHPQPKQN